MFLEQAEGLGLRSAIGLAATNEDKTVTEGLLKIVNDPKDDDFYRRIRNSAVLALANSGKWDAVLAFVEREGSVGESLLEWPDSDVRPEPSSLDGVCRRAAEHSIGAIHALGFGQGEPGSAIVRHVLAEVEPGSEVAHACVSSLSLMRDDSLEVIPLLRKQLQFQRTALPATIALMVNGHSAALRALVESPNRDLPGACMKLVEGLGDEKVSEEIRASLSERCGSKGEPDLMYTIAYLVIKSGKCKKLLLGDQHIVDFIWSAAYAPPRSFLRPSDRELAIRCLVEDHPEGGFRAALAALRTTVIPDRRNYPHILMRADSGKAAPLLLDHLVDESQSSVKASIGRALAGWDIDSELGRRLSAENTSERGAACFAAGWAGRSEGVVGRVRQLVTDDPEPDVNKAAISALNRIAIRRETRLLAQEVLDADGEFDRWLYLDALLSYADPGDHYSPWPVEGPLVDKVLTPLQSLHVRQTRQRGIDALAKKQASDDRMAAN